MKHQVMMWPDENGDIKEVHLLEQRAPNGRLAAAVVSFDPECQDRKMKAHRLAADRWGIRVLIAHEGQA